MGKCDQYWGEKAVNRNLLQAVPDRGWSKDIKAAVINLFK